MRKAAINVIKCFKCSDSDEKLIDALLFTIARDNECEIIINELVNYKDWYELLAKKSLGSKYINSEWQFAKKLEIVMIVINSLSLNLLSQIMNILQEWHFHLWQN